VSGGTGFKMTDDRYRKLDVGYWITFNPKTYYLYSYLSLKLYFERKYCLLKNNLTFIGVPPTYIFMFCQKQNQQRLLLFGSIFSQEVHCL